MPIYIPPASYTPPPPYSKTLFPLQFLRQQAYPVDVDQVFESTTDRNAYLTSPRRYAGQLVVDNEAQVCLMLNNTRNAWVHITGAKVFQTTNDRVAFIGNADAFDGLIGIDLSETVGLYVYQNGAWVDPRLPKIINSVVDVTLGYEHKHAIIRMNSSSDIYVQVPTNGNIPFDIGTTFVISKTGTGNVIVAGLPGVLINTPRSLIISNQHGKATLTKVGINEWDLEGNLQ